MARRPPPAPKERPVALANTSAPRLAPPLLPAPPERPTLKSDDVGAICFIVLVVLGLLASARAFLLLGA